MQKKVVIVKVFRSNGELIVRKESTESQVMQIIKGNINHLFPTSPIKQLSKERLNICKGCSLFIEQTNRCDPHNYIIHEITGNPVKGCGCKLPQKTKNYDSSCPAMKWGAYKNEEDYLSEKGGI